MPITVAWLERGQKPLKKRWCRASCKKTLRYQDHVRTACGFVVNFPVDLSDSQEPDCPECLEKER